MFESLRRSLNDLLDKATRPEDRRAIASRMRDTLVQAKVGLEDLRTALQKSRIRLEHDRSELETIRRRRAMAANIGDDETVRVAERYEQMHAERVSVMERKIEAQESELVLAEREIGEMTSELRNALHGVGPSAGRVPDYDKAATEELERELDTEPAREEFNAMARQHARAEREADAQRQLDELKRRMGK